MLVDATPIDSLGTQCTPGYTLAHGWGPYSNPMDLLPPTTALAAANGYAVLAPDHEGPTMVYSDPLTAGHVTLDAIRGMSRVAPELAPRIVGVSAGGVPADVRMELHSMSGNVAVGLLTAAVSGMARQHPEVVELANTLALPGATLAPIDALTVGDGALATDVAERLSARVGMADHTAVVPLYVYQGMHEFWLPPDGTRDLVAQQCALGATVEYHEVVGEHGIAALSGYPVEMAWLDARLRGLPPAQGCSTGPGGAPQAPSG